MIYPGSVPAYYQKVNFLYYQQWRSQREGRGAESRLKINFFNPLVKFSVSKIYSLKWNHYLLNYILLLKNKQTNKQTKVLVAEKKMCVVEFSTHCLVQPTLKMQASECEFRGLGRVPPLTEKKKWQKNQEGIEKKWAKNCA